MQVAQELLDKELCASVGVGGADLDALGDRHLLDEAVHGGGGGEDELLAALLHEQVEEVAGAGEVVVVVLDRHFDALADGLVAGEVDAGVEGELLEDDGEGVVVQQVDVAEDDLVRLAGEAGHALERLLRGVGEVVHDHRSHALVHHLQDGVRADVAGAAGDEDILHGAVGRVAVEKVAADLGVAVDRWLSAAEDGDG